MIKKTENIIISALALLVIALGYMNYNGYSIIGNGNVPKISAKEAGAKALAFVNNRILKNSADKATLLGDIVKEKGMYKITMKIGKQNFASFVTTDGTMLFPERYGIDMTVKPKEEKPAAKVPKKDIPDFKLFVMSYCPFGLQAEKGFLPVYDLLKDKAKTEIYFVDYAMHGKKELDENSRQYCIQKEQNDKYINYLKCFVDEGDYKKCLTTAKVQIPQMETCVAKLDKEFNITKDYNNKDTWNNGRFPVYNVNADLNKKYDVGGSPVFVINGIKTSIGRSPEAIKTAICNAFTNPPKECETKLSSKTPSSGFGNKEGNSGGGGSCGD